MFEKAHREDKALDTRPARRERDAVGDDVAVSKKSSALWLAEGSRREQAVGKEGTRDAATELPFRGELEASLGTDLSHVKAHTGSNAKAATDALGAEAYAMRDEQAIVFGDANPSKDLVAHEVVHTLQHGAGAVSQDETEADAVGGRIAAGERVDRGAIKSGGGKVRKREQSNLSKIFDDFLKGVESNAESRYGDDAEAKGSAASQTQDGVFESSSEDRDVKLTAGGMQITNVENEKIGVAELRSEVEAGIAEAKNTINRQLMVGNLAKAGIEFFDKPGVQAEIDALDSENLEPTLVAAKRTQLTGKLAALDKQIAKHVADLKQLEQTRGLLDRIAADIPKGLDGIPQALVDAEKSFRGTEVTKKSTFGFDVLAGKINRSIEVERVETDEAGKHASSISKSSSTKLGGGITHESGVTRKRTETDTAGKSHSTEVGTTTKSSVKVNEDGSYGYGKEKKLSGAIENSYGKATGGAGLSGAFTTNIIEIPQGEGKEPPHYAVVTTINVGLALEAGLEKEKDVAKKTKFKASISAKGGVEAQITQTHVLDQQEVKRYLKALDDISGGAKPAGTKPEFQILYKAVNCIGSVDEIMLGAAATVGSSDAAKTMAVDESVELTTKVSGEIDGSVGLGPVGGSAGAKQDLYRSMKIGRVTGKAGQELIEVSVTFGESEDVHGALTGSALGVSATVGSKEWSSSQEAVTFRLDPEATDYATLYDEIIVSKSPSDLAELRKSLRFAKHVHGYSSKQTTGDESTVGISGGLMGLADAETSQRSSERAMTDGNLSAVEAGQQGKSTGFLLGPLELLKRSQVDAARFEIQDGVSTLDISEKTSTSSVGQFDWSLKGLITAESPAKAAEKALLKTNDTLAGFLLDHDDIERLVKIAKQDADVWSEVADFVDGGRDTERAIAWESLRRALAHGKPPNDPTIPIEFARDLFLGGSVATFMTAGSGAKGEDYVRTLLRNPKAVGGRDAMDVGVAYEFKGDVSGDKYKDVRRKCKGVEIHLETFVADREKGIEPGMAYVAELKVELAKLLKTVEESYEFAEERSRIEMIAELRGFAADFPRIERELVRKCTGVEVSAEQEDLDARADERARINQLEISLEKSKVSEDWLLDRMDARLEYTGQERANEMAPLITNLRHQLEAHRFLVKQLRAAYSAACIDGSAWRVSTDRDDKRRDLDIDSPRFIALFETYQQSIGLGIAALGGEDIKQMSEVVSETRRY